MKYFVMLMHIGFPDTAGQKHSNFKITRWQTALIWFWKWKLQFSLNFLRM